MKTYVKIPIETLKRTVVLFVKNKCYEITQNEIISLDSPSPPGSPVHSEDMGVSSTTTIPKTVKSYLNLYFTSDEAKNKFFVDQSAHKS
ncbi:hypothetical protein DOY81_011212 [Sarcophaga bullata]|nr:hypothetical protein DOY81_011212 [Sarcophaga bullata]